MATRLALLHCISYQSQLSRGECQKLQCTGWCSTKEWQNTNKPMIVVGWNNWSQQPSTTQKLNLTSEQAAGVWCTPVPAGPASEEVTRRCRHAVAAVGPYVFIFGGLRGSTLLDDFLLADDSSGTELSICDPRSPAW